MGKSESKSKDESLRYGGKGAHLRILERAGFSIPETLFGKGLDVGSLDKGTRYVVRSSAVGEDTMSHTAAGKYDSVVNVGADQVGAAIEQVANRYGDGNVIVQPDLSAQMRYSGVIYTNLDGKVHISMGAGSKVHEIVAGGEGEITVIAGSNGYSMRGQELVNPNVVELLVSEAKKVESLFGIPTDIEFAYLNDGKLVLLQARPLPNPTSNALRESEIRRFEELIAPLKEAGLKEAVLGIGNYREILGDDKATELSTSLFNYIFSGEGDTLGGMQLGRNELGYENGTEIQPWVLMLGGKVYYNFAADALQFRPKGVSVKDMLKVINGLYVPRIRENPELLNYPELGFYIQFPEQAKQAGLKSEPFSVLAEKAGGASLSISMPDRPPVKRAAREYANSGDCLDAIALAADEIRKGSAKEYCKAARLAFFALEALRNDLEKLRAESPKEFSRLSKLFGSSSVEGLRDAVAYNGSIGSFEPPETEEYRYQGGFELSQPRGWAQARKLNTGKELGNLAVEASSDNTRRMLEYREKMKFFLFRDFDHLKQLVDQFGQLTGFGNSIYRLTLSELKIATDEPLLAGYRIELRGSMRGQNLFGDPIFENDLRSGAKGIARRSQPRLIFGSLREAISVAPGDGARLVSAVDQTVSIPEGTKVVIVSDNIRPGSHLFTLLSDYQLPVIAVPRDDLDRVAGSERIRISAEGGNVKIDYN
ncbi:MAG: hypothetical protein KGI04_04365 [Candidatus Micrarchaeota archaeon]|nr:hypothetical protein [Candidatus Micrarchaeota archaeon]